MSIVTADIPTSLKAALDTEVVRIKGSGSSVITAALAQYLGTPIHTLFQISTSGALVAGVYSGVVNAKAKAKLNTLLEVQEIFGEGNFLRLNQLYWDQGNYRGIGSAAHSHQDGTRWWNVRTPDRYIDAVEAGRSPEGGREVLTDEQRRFEALALALRTPVGVPWPALEDDQDLVGLVQRRGDQAVLTVRGRLLANEVSARIRSGILHR